MDITQFFVSEREEAKLNGDHAAYCSHLSNRIHNLRKRLGIATKPRAKFLKHSAVSRANIREDHQYVYLLILYSERAWANAMSMREAHASGMKAITGATRSHIISRLSKSAKYATELHELLTDQTEAISDQNDVLESQAYAASLNGAKAFEKQHWEDCINHFAEARVIYSALATATNREIFQVLLSDTIDPSIRYGAYRLGIPRSVAVSVIARQHFPKISRLITEVEELDPNVLKDRHMTSLTSDAKAIPESIVWRSRTVALADASIVATLTSVAAASKRLIEGSKSDRAANSKEKAAAYDEILIASQDAVDATKNAIEELLSEGVRQSDRRIQNLQVTRTALSYDLISWRIGRNRVLVGDADGLVTTQSMSNDQTFQIARRALTQESCARTLAQLTGKNVLYDAILQSLETIKELPGVVSDSSLLKELDARHHYFQALKSLTIARSYALISMPDESLALLNLAVEQCNHAFHDASDLLGWEESTPPNISVTRAQVQRLLDHLEGDLRRFHGLVELSRLLGENQDKEQYSLLVERVDKFPIKELNLKQLVQYPPKLRLIPVKPLFFDAAWNYIEYPGREQSTQLTQGNLSAPQDSTEMQQQRKGWFNFGR